MDAWKQCRKIIVEKNLPFTSFNVPSEYCSSQPDAYFRPMEQIDLSPLSVRAQEQHFVKDLFLVYMSYQGNSIRFVKVDDTVTWTVNPSGDACLRSSLYTDTCLPLAAILILLRHNIKNLRSELSRGRLALAVGYAAEEFFNTEIMPLLVKLERENRTDQRSLTIGEVATYMRPYLQITKQLNDVLSTIIKKELVGGEVLTLLAEQERKCVSPSTREMLHHFEIAGLAQYFEHLFWWIRYGKIQDYCHEFMIWDLKSTRMFTRSDILSGTDKEFSDDNLNSFDDRFCVVKALCPSQLLPAFQDIVKCGIYLNIVEKIRGESTAFDNERVGEQLEDWKQKEVEDVLREVKKARLNASEDLVRLLRKQFGLDEYFESLRDFMLLQCSDWLISFAELSRDMLSCSIRDISIKKMQMLFEEAVDCSTLSFDRRRHIFRPVLEKNDVFTALRAIGEKAGQKGVILKDFETTESKCGMDALSINISVDSPLSLVFPRQILLYYNLLFRILFYLHSAMSLIFSKQVWGDFVTLKERLLLQKMFHFWNAYNLHCSMHVIPCLWDVFMEKLLKSASLEQILSFQDAFFGDAMAQCFLPDLSFMNLIEDMVTVVRNFTTDVADYEQSEIRWNDCLKKMHSLLSKPNNNSAYAQLHSRIFSLLY